MNFITLFGYVAAALTTFSFLPQTLKTIKDKNTDGISGIMYTMFSIGVLAWTIYGLFTHNLPVILANLVTLVFAVIILYMKVKNSRGNRPKGTSN